MSKFKPGQSGNPGGRPKEAEDVKKLARDYTREAIDKLAFWMRSDNAKASVTASSVLLDRAYGKAPQAIDVTHNKNLLDELTTDELASLIATVTGKTGSDRSGSDKDTEPKEAGSVPSVH
jgi:hypothetical protein